MPITETDTTVAIHRPALSSAVAAFLAKKHQMLIDGKWVDARSGATFAVEDPATEKSSPRFRRAIRRISI